MKYQMTCAGGAPPHTDTLIRPAACGQVQIGPFKTTPQCAKLSLPVLATRPPTPCKDDLEAGPLEPMCVCLCVIMYVRILIL